MNHAAALKALPRDIAEEVVRRGEKRRCERSLSYFLEAAWPHFEGSRFRGNWHIDAIAEHLEAVSHGYIKRLIINVPPRHGKTGLVSVAWPVWTWIQERREGHMLMGPQVTFLCASYGAKKAQEDGVTARRLIGTVWFQSFWSDRCVISGDRDNQERYDTTAGGSRISTGIPESLGKGGLIRILDDPHKTDEVESQLQRETVIRAYREVWATRSNDAALGAEVLIMQRLAENDLTGYMLGELDDVVHLMIPARYDALRHCATVIGWEDPRTKDGELLWAERFSEEWAKRQEAEAGPYAWAAQYQQAPSPRGGGLIKAEWWQEWAAKESPPVEFVLASLDTAVKEKEQSDYYALVVLAVWRDPDTGVPKILLLYAWRERAPLHDIVERVIRTCKQFKVDRLVIEDKSHGWVAQQELKRMSAGWKFGITMFDPGRYGDKTARLLSVQHLFAEGLIYAPVTADEFGNVTWRKWADEVISETCNFPKAAHDDLVDALSQGLRHLRDIGFALRKEEHARDEASGREFKSRPKPLYDT